MCSLSFWQVISEEAINSILKVCHSDSYEKLEVTIKVQYTFMLKLMMYQGAVMVFSFMSFGLQFNLGFFFGGGSNLM